LAAGVQDSTKTVSKEDEVAQIGTGYGHIAITGDHLDATLAMLVEQGVESEKRPYDHRGRQSHRVRPRSR
jgi:hypothetical protein